MLFPLSWNKGFQRTFPLVEWHFAPCRLVTLIAHPWAGAFIQLIPGVGLLYVRSIKKLLFFLSPQNYIHSWGCWLLGLLNSPNINSKKTYLRAQTMFSCPLGKAVWLVSSFGSVGYSSSLGHFPITVKSISYNLRGSRKSSPISSATVDWPVASASSNVRLGRKTTWGHVRTKLAF